MSSNSTELSVTRRFAHIISRSALVPTGSAIGGGSVGITTRLGVAGLTAAEPPPLPAWLEVPYIRSPSALASTTALEDMSPSMSSLHARWVLAMYIAYLQRVGHAQLARSSLEIPCLPYMVAKPRRQGSYPYVFDPSLVVQDHI